MRKIRRIFYLLPILSMIIPVIMAGKNYLPEMPSLASGKAKTENCKKRKQPVTVKLSREKYPQSAFHVETALRMGQPRVLRIERTNTEKKRDQWGKVVGEIDGLKQKKLDQDEYPPAMSSDKRGAGREANIALINASDNRGAGSSMGNQLSRYCDGQRFQIKPSGRYRGPVSITVVANNGKRISRTVSR